jgi:hypothetical protein
MTLIGNANAFVGLTIDLRTIGPVPVIVGQGICGLVGLSTRGPVAVANPLGIPSDAAKQYYSGDLKVAIETAFAQGCPVIYAVRVLGVGYAKATASVNDSGTVPAPVGTISAYSEGAWGNSVTVKITEGNFDSTDVEIFPGDGTVGPYALQMCDLTTDSTQPSGFPIVDSVKVNNVAYTLTNHSGSLANNTVYVDSANGTLTFYTNQAPAPTDLISVSLKYHTKNFTVSDNISTEVHNNVRSLLALSAAFDNSSLVSFAAGPGATHLPAVNNLSLTGGNDGTTITPNDWLNALNILQTGILPSSPTTVAITSNTSNPLDASTDNDLIAVLDGWSAYMADIFEPCQCFVAANPGLAVADLLELASGLNNKWLSIEGNGWDNSSVPINLAVARAAKEAAVSLGTSCAEAQNAINGATGLLYQFNQDECDALTRSGIDVIIKQRGIKPYVGITTATDWQFMRTVDMRTVNYVIVALNFICQAYYFKRNTPQVRSALQASIEAMLKEQVTLQNVLAYAIKVYPDIDPNRVNIDLTMENIGHIERIRTVMSVGIMVTATTTSNTANSSTFTPSGYTPV